MLSANYVEFGKLFINSLLDYTNVEKINKVGIIDTGIPEDFKSYLSQFPKIEIVPTNDTEPSLKIHDKAWENKTYSKSGYMLEYIEKQPEFTPTILFDCDIIFCRDFFDLLDSNEYKDSDVIACKRNQAGRAIGHVSTSSHIGSFVCIKTPKGIPFLKDWIKILNDSIKFNNEPAPQKESPALSKAMAAYKEKIVTSDICERVIANIERPLPDDYKDMRAMHLKSEYDMLTIGARLTQDRARPYYNKYVLGK